MIDLLVKNATLPDGRQGMDIACVGGKIAEVAPAITAEAREVIDARGYLVSPPFIDAHFHMDATLSLGMPRLNQSGTLLEGIAVWGELKPLLTHEAVVERAMRYCDLAVTQGLLAIRTHVDVCDDRLLCVEALLEVRKRDRSPISTCSSWPSRRMASTAIPLRRRTCCARSTSASTWWAASRMASAPWRMARRA